MTARFLSELLFAIYSVLASNGSFYGNGMFPSTSCNGWERTAVGHVRNSR